MKPDVHKKRAHTAKKEGLVALVPDATGSLLLLAVETNFASVFVEWLIVGVKVTENVMHHKEKKDMNAHCRIDALCAWKSCCKIYRFLFSWE